MKRIFEGCLLAIAVSRIALPSAHATVALAPLFSTNMVLQRGKPCPVSGTAAANKTITVQFNTQTKTTTSDTAGNWQLSLDAMVAKTTGGDLTARESGANTVTLTNVVVGDVWICSGQSNMAFGLGGCNRQTDIDSANYPAMRTFSAPLVTSDVPLKTITGSWTVCSPSTASGFSAVAFYFGRKICQDQGSAIPIGLFVSSVGGTRIDPWLAPEGATDIPVLAPLYSQNILPWGPFALFNGMVYPYAPLPAKGLIWYQGENSENTTQSTDSYFLKMKALSQGYKRMLGLDDFAFYFVQLAYWGTVPSNATPVLTSGGWDADTRIQQANAMALPHAGMASALDIGDTADMHPTDKLDLGERLALWALKNDYGRAITETSGPILKNVTISGNTLICSFDHIGSGLMVGSKTPYVPTAEVVGGTLQKFSISGASGTWYDGTATIVGDTVVVSSASVTTPRRVAYACWQNPVGCNLYNKNGLPASPFYVDDVNAKYTITATAGSGGSISPAGDTTLLKRATALYTITPDAAKYITDVTVDGVSVGAVKYYTFDPLYANHTIAATFAASVPNFTVTASSNSGGMLSPSGPVTIAQGGSQTFTVVPNAGTKIASLSVDGKSICPRSSFTFGDVRINHTIAATFACVITASASYGGTITPSGPTTVSYAGNQTYNITANSGYSISAVTVDGVNVGAVTSYTFTNAIANHTIAASFSSSNGGTGSVPQTGQIIVSALASSVPSIGNWATYYPAGQTLTTIGSPAQETLSGRQWERNVYADGDGYRFGGSYSSAIACTGASIVVAARPVRSADSGGWRSIVDVFYDRLVLGITNDGGLVNVRRNGSTDYSSTAIFDGQIVILSLVVQSNGTYKVWVNGTQVMNNTTTSTMTSLVPGVTGGAGGYGTYINVGRNNPDGWTTFNGNIGDVFLYKTALSDPERQQLEQYIANKLTDYTLTASAGAGGTISPSGTVTVMSGTNQTFTIAPNANYRISDVMVDSVSQGIKTSHTFSSVSAGHTISASFTLLPTPTVTITGTTSFTYSGSPQGPDTATTGGSTGAVTYSYSGVSGTTYPASATKPTGAGSYTVTATVAADANYSSGSSSAAPFTIAKATATIALGNLTHNYDGTQKSAAATTGPAGLTVVLTYNTSPTPPTNVGSYIVVATINETNHAGTAGGTLVITESFLSWRNEHFTTQEIADGRGASDADPDGDGTNNLPEFAFNGDPRDGTSNGMFFTRVIDPGGANSALTLTCAMRRSSTTTFPVSGVQTATLNGVTYTIHGSTFLSGNWESPVSHVGKSDDPPAGSGLLGLAGTGWEYRTFSAFNGLANKGFLRARVEPGP